MKKLYTLLIGLFIVFNFQSKAQVTLDYFTGYQIGSTIELHWQTSSENNMDYFELTVSTDMCATFASFTNVPASGSTTTISNYSITSTGPFIDLCYCFKLAAIDLSGTSYNLDTVMVCYSSAATSISEEEMSSSINLFPNPYKEGQLTILNDGKKICNLYIYNSNGQLVLSANNIESNFTFDLSEKEAGIYLIQLIDQQGQSYLRKLIKE